MHFLHVNIFVPLTCYIGLVLNGGFHFCFCTWASYCHLLAISGEALLQTQDTETGEK